MLVEHDFRADERSPRGVDDPSSHLSVAEEFDRRRLFRSGIEDDGPDLPNLLGGFLADHDAHDRPAIIGKTGILKLGFHFGKRPSTDIPGGDRVQSIDFPAGRRLDEKSAVRTGQDLFPPA